MTQLDADVIVVGGGPAGSSTAYFLARRGFEVLVVDRAKFPRDKPCSEYMSPQGARILDAMGVLEKVENAGAEKLNGMTVTSPAGLTIRGDFKGEHGYRGYRDHGIALRRTVLDEILLRNAEAAGVRVLEGAKVTDVVRADDGRVSGVQIAGGDCPRQLRSRLVIGADGLRSVVGRRLGLIRQGWPRRIALVSHYRGIEGMKDVGEIHLESGAYCGVSNVGGGVTNVAIVVPASRSAELAGDHTAFFEEWFSSRPRFAPRFANAERVTPVRATGPFASAARKAWVPGAALVGDAADFFDPITGEGVYAALRGAEILADHAAKAVPASDGGSRQLADYDAARKREFSGKWKVERLVGMSLFSTVAMNRIARVLAANKDMADLFVGVAGDFIPPREILNPKFFLKLAFARGVGA